MKNREHLQYVKNTDGNATVAQFNDDWEPIGPMVRRDIMPALVTTNEFGFLVLTEQGRAALEQKN